MMEDKNGTGSLIKTLDFMVRCMLISNLGEKLIVQKKSGKRCGRNRDIGYFLNVAHLNPNPFSCVCQRKWSWIGAGCALKNATV